PEASSRSSTVRRLAIPWPAWALEPSAASASRSTSTPPRPVSANSTTRPAWSTESPAPPAAAGGAGLSVDQAGRVVEFAETGRGGVEVLREAEAALGSNAHAGHGIANLRTVLDLLDAS